MKSLVARHVSMTSQQRFQPLCTTLFKPIRTKPTPAIQAFGLQRAHEPHAHQDASSPRGRKILLNSDSPQLSYLPQRLSCRYSFVMTCFLHRGYKLKRYPKRNYIRASGYLVWAKARFKEEEKKLSRENFRGSRRCLKMPVNLDYQEPYPGPRKYSTQWPKTLKRSRNCQTFAQFWVPRRSLRNSFLFFYYNINIRSCQN